MYLKFGSLYSNGSHGSEQSLHTYICTNKCKTKTFGKGGRLQRIHFQQMHQCHREQFFLLRYKVSSHVGCCNLEVHVVTCIYMHEQITQYSGKCAQVCSFRTLLPGNVVATALRYS